MNIESLGRQAIDRIKSEWGLPKRGFLAGGSIANIVWELVSGNKAVVSDIDIFIFDLLLISLSKSEKKNAVNHTLNLSAISFNSLSGAAKFID